jgi:voltage-gated potassium channel Kch
MPLGTQSKILRVLTEQQFTRVGGADKVRVDLRVISSTCRDLRSEIGLGRFRQELYDRLNVVPIAVPSLSARREDVPELTRHFIDWFHKTQGLPNRTLSDEADTVLQTLPWPGNIRQLRNVIERILILGDGTGPIEAAEIPRQRAQGRGGKRLVALRHHRHAAAARGARAFRTRIPPDPDQPVRRQHQPHGQLCRDGTLGPAPEAEVARRGRFDAWGQGVHGLRRIDRSARRHLRRRPGRPASGEPCHPCHPCGLIRLPRRHGRPDPATLTLRPRSDIQSRTTERGELMKVIICGAGQVGWQIARHLSGEKNDVTLVDMNADLVRRATDTLDVQGVVGFASHPDTLAKAGARDADMLIAATHSDEVNMVTCQVAHVVFNVTRKIARIRAQNYLDPLYGT